MKDENTKNIRRKGVYLVVVDGSHEFIASVDAAAGFANAEGGYVALLNVIEPMPVQNWQNIEDRVRAEMREHAEEMIWNAAGQVVESNGSMPMVFIEEGDNSDIIIKTIEENKNIVALVLASSATTSKPGPLVSYFSGKGLARLPVPLIIIPGHLGDK